MWSRIQRAWSTRGLCVVHGLSTRPAGRWLVRRTRPHIHKPPVPARSKLQQGFYNSTIDANVGDYKIQRTLQWRLVALLPY